MTILDDEELAWALFRAVGPLGSLAEAERLLEAGARATFQQKAPGGWTTRMQAVDRRRELLGRFVGHPRVDVMDAAIDGDVAAVREFLALGSSPNAVDVYRQKTPLGYAARLGHAWADAHPTDTKGRTAMHCSLRTGHRRDPDEAYDYLDEALARPIPKALLAAGLAIPPRA